MNLKEKLELCSKNYKRWRNRVFSAQDLNEAKRAAEKAFFWLELSSAFIWLWNIERLKGNNPKTLEKIVIAKTNLSKKLVEYMEKILEEIKWKIK
jgi:hypothetical protein